MKLLQTANGIAAYENGQVCFFDAPFDTLQACLQENGMQRLVQARRDNGVTRLMPFAEAVTQLVPLCQPQHFVIAGLNYRAHCEEIGRPVPEKLVFGPAPGTAVHVHDAPVRIPGDVTETDYEGEIGVVIGAPAHEIAAADAWSVVAGLVPLNDVSARDVQAQGTLEAVGKAKGFPTFKPMGPCLSTADEFADVLDISIRTWVNGELRQQGRSGDMVFNIPEIVARVTARLALQPGDVICTGTPGGVAHGGAFPYLQPGDLVEVELQGQPRLRNTFTAA